MIHALEQEQENYRSKLFHFQGMYDQNAGGRHAKSLSVGDRASLDESSMDDRGIFRSQGPRPVNDQSVEKQQIGSALNRNDKGPRSRFSKDEVGAGPKDKQNQGKINFKVHKHSI